jgi:hypothetical protein
MCQTGSIVAIWPGWYSGEIERFPLARIAASMPIAVYLQVLHWRKHAPADLPKEAASFDLPIALGILMGSGQMEHELLWHYAVMGELSIYETAAGQSSTVSVN